MSETPSDPYTYWRRRAVVAWRRRAEAAEAEIARLNMEMVAYRENLTPKDVKAMTAVIEALQSVKDGAFTEREMEK